MTKFILVILILILSVLSIFFERYLNMLFKFILLLSCTICLVSCVGGAPAEVTMGDPYISALKTVRLIGASDSQSLAVGYKFVGEQCYGGDINRDGTSDFCQYKNSDTSIRVNNTSIINGTNTYNIQLVKSMKINNNVFILDKEYKLWICTFNGKCSVTQNQYIDIIAIDFDVLKCKDDLCKNSGKTYASILAITKSIATIKSSGKYIISSELHQIFINSAKDTGVQIWNQQNDYAYSIKRVDLNNTVPIAEEYDSNKISSPQVSTLSFTMVSHDSAHIQLAYNRDSNKGGAYETWYLGFNYGENLIKNSISTNSNVLRQNKLNRLVIFTPEGKEPIFPGGTLYTKLIEDLRVVAGGKNDKGDNYQFCIGLNIYCSIGLQYKYDAIKNNNYTGDLLDNLIFQATFLGVDAFLGKMSRKVIKTADKKITNTFFRSVAKEGSSHLIPFIGSNGLMAATSMYGMELHNVFYDMTTEDKYKDMPLLALTAKEFIQFPLAYKLMAYTGKSNVWGYTQSTCERTIIKEFLDVELKLRTNRTTSVFLTPKSLYDIFSDNRTICEAEVAKLGKKNFPFDITKFEQQYKSTMQQITLTSLAEFKSSVVGMVYTKLFIESSNEIATSIYDEGLQQQLDMFQDKVTSKDSEQLLADISLRLTNCKDGVCEPTYFADESGNWLKDKNGNYINAMLGNYINLSYSRDTSDVAPSFLYRLAGGSVPELSYSINAYQLSDLNCAEFTSHIQKLTGKDIDKIGVLSALKNRDSWGIVIDNNGNKCGMPSTNYEKYVYEYDKNLIGDIFMFIPMGVSGSSILFGYALQFGMDALQNTLKKNLLFNPFSYEIRNSHLTTQDNPYNCSNIALESQLFALKLESKISGLNQVAQSMVNKDGLWMIGKNGLYYLENEKNEPLRCKHAQYLECKNFYRAMAGYQPSLV